MPTNYNPRTIPSTVCSVRTGVQTDFGYLITQLGILCDNSGNRIVFHTGQFEQGFTPYTPKTEPIASIYSVRTPI